LTAYKVTRNNDDLKTLFSMWYYSTTLQKSSWKWLFLRSRIRSPYQ